MAAELQFLKEEIVNCLTDKHSQPGIYANVPDKQVQVPNCDNSSATSDNQNHGIKFDGMPKEGSLNTEERFLSVVILVTDIVPCLDPNSAHIISNIKRMSPEDTKN